MAKNKVNPIPFRPQQDTHDALHKAAHKEDRSINFLIERAVRKDLKLDRKR